MATDDAGQADLSAPLHAGQQAAVLGQLTEGVILTDQAGRITFINEAAARLHGIDRLGIEPDRYTDVYQLTTEDGRPYPPRELPLARAVFDGETVIDARWLIHRPDGTVVIASGSARPLRDTQGVQTGAVLSVHDETARVQAERSLREESQTLEILNRVGAAVAGELNLERIVQMVTDAGVELLGAAMGAFFYNVRKEEGGSMLLYTLSGVDRQVFDAYPMPRASALFRPTLSGDGVIRADDIQRDPRYGKSPPFYGMPPGHPPVRSYLAVPVTSRSGEAIGGLFFGHPQAQRFTERHERLMVGIAAHAAIAIDNARLYGIAQREIDERRVAEERLRQLNETLEQRVEARTHERDRAWKHSRDLQAVIDDQGRFLQVSDAWTAILGWQPHEVVGHASVEFVHPDDRAASTRPFFASLGAGPAFENRCLHKDGSYRWISWVASEEGRAIYASGRDITEQKAQAQTLAMAEEALRQSQKMEAVGHLTGGIAHDFNNMLAVMIGSLELLQRKLGDDAPARRHADNALEAANRAALLTRRLLAFSRQQPLSPQPVDVNALVRGMSELLQHSIGADIRLETSLADDLWPTQVDPNQLENVILNLAVNARDAMADGGRLGIETANARLDDHHAAAGVTPGDYVAIMVTDSGVGMPAEVIDRAFDPFFTTKPAGKGTGLGLSQVYGFVKQSGGHIQLYSEPGRGTSAKIYLPRLHDAAARREEPLPPAPHARPGRGELILLVDDEPAVRQFSAEALLELGYRVLQADGAEAALRLLDEHADVALLFTDVVMPDTDGRKLADEARRRRPGLKVLFTTGYARSAVVHNGMLDRDVELLGKPFTMDELARKLRQMLDRT